MNITADEIITYRKSKGLSQEDLASILGVSKNTVYNYERGEKIPDSKIQILYKTINDAVSDVVSNAVKEDEFTTLLVNKLFDSETFKNKLEEFINEKIPNVDEGEVLEYYSRLVDRVKKEGDKKKI